MINSTKILTALELRNLYGWNVFRHTKDKKAKTRYVGLMCVWIMLILMVFFYVGALTYGLVFLGLGEIVPTYLTVIASLLIFFFGFFKAGNMIFAKKGYDIISSLPVKASSIVISRFVSMYVQDLLLVLLIMLPGAVVYGYLVTPGFRFYLTLLLCVLFIPALPLVAATAVGSLIMAISARLKHKTLIQIILTLVFIIVLLSGSLNTGLMAENISPEMLFTLADSIGDLLGQLYPPAAWLGNAVIFHRLSDLLLFIGSAVLSMVLMTALVSKNFHRISRGLLVTSAKHNYQMETLKSSSMLSALYKRDLKRYFASGIYVTNTIISPIMGTILSAAILIAGTDTIQNSISLPIDILGLIPFAIAGVFGLVTTTSVSISMEGKEFWIVKTLPISTKNFLDSKILLNLSLLLPFYVLSEILLALAIKPTLLELLWLILIPIILILFSVVLGITINLRFHNFNWEKEGVVVKQSASASISMLAGFPVAFLCGIPVALTPEQYINFTKAIVCVLILIITALLYRANNKTRLLKL